MQADEFANYGLPVWKLSTISKFKRDEILKYQHVKPWKHCDNPGCQEPARFYCARCKHVRFRDPTRYCSRKCQRKDWLFHHGRCDASINLEAAHARGQVPNLDWDGMRQAYRWGNAMKYGGLMDWVAKQAHISSPSKDPSRRSLHIEMKSIDPTDACSHVIPYKFQWIPYESYDSAERFHPIPANQRQKITWYSYEINSVVQSQDWTRVDIDPRGHPVLPVAYWPYIFAVCAMFGDIHSNVNGVRRDILIETLAFSFNVQSRKLLEPFANNQFTDTLELSGENVFRFMEIMYPVTSSIRSRFHCPCGKKSQAIAHR